jgi:acetyl esterase/lipase
VADRLDSDRPAPLPITPAIAASMTEFLEFWPKKLTLDNLAETRVACEQQLYPRSIDEHVGQRPMDVAECQIEGSGGESVTLALYRPTTCHGPAPVLLFIHGGGLVTGNRFTEDLNLLDLAVDAGVSVVSIEYRLAPEHPFPAAIEDCYAAWQWLLADPADYGFDPGRVVLVGESAGGGLAAALAILIRDRGGRQPLAQLLATPMLDHRNDSPSVRQQNGLGVWDEVSNSTGWGAYLGALAGSDTVPAYAAPASAQDLSSLPPAFIDAADAEIFRDEVMVYATKLWLAGVPAELHIWTGGCHGFYGMIPELPMAKVVYDTRLEWLRRMVFGTARRDHN